MKQTSLAQSQFVHRRYWPIWVVIGLGKLITYLPHKLQIRLGAGLGLTVHTLFARHRKHIVDTNLRLCFPEMTDGERRKLTREVFRSNGIGLIETAVSWLGDVDSKAQRVEFHGLDILDAALAEGKGCLLLGMHFSTLDLCGALLARQIPFDVMYRRNKNLLQEALMTRGRERNFPNAIERKNIRGVIQAIRQGHAVWYGPDQDYGPKHSIFAPFFGVPTASITATARIARATGAPVVVFSHYRTTDDEKYIIELARLEGFPDEDDVVSASLVNQAVETAIMKAPDQYWWVHRRFKTRPEGEARPY